MNNHKKLILQCVGAFVAGVVAHRVITDVRIAQLLKKRGV